MTQAMHRDTLRWALVLALLGLAVMALGLGVVLLAVVGCLHAALAALRWTARWHESRECVARGWMGAA